MISDPLNSSLHPQPALVVRIGTGLYAIPVEMVEEVWPALPIDVIPQCPAFMRGVVFVRGHLVPVFDAAERLGLRDHVRLPDPNIVCLRVGGRWVGLEVDETVNLCEIPWHRALPVVEVNLPSGFLSQLVEVNGQVIRILDVERMVAQPETEVIDALPGGDSIM